MVIMYSSNMWWYLFTLLQALLLTKESLDMEPKISTKCMTV